MSQTRQNVVHRNAAATLVWTVPVRLVDLGRSGCRLEVGRHIQPGTSGCLRVVMNGAARSDDVRVSRCLLRKGAGGTYDVGAELLPTRSLESGSLRAAVQDLVTRSSSPARSIEPGAHLSSAGQVDHAVRNESRAVPLPALSESQSIG